MNVEQQLQAIKDKAELIEWVHALPDDARGVVIIDRPSAAKDDVALSFREIGEMSTMEMVYFFELCKNCLLRH